jgi:membrane protease YdiL (CAAX protease family)
MLDDSSKPSPASAASPGWGPFTGVLYGFGIALLGVQIGVGMLLGLVLGLSGMSSTAIGDWMNTIHGQFIFTAAAEIVMFAAIIFYVKQRGGSLKSIGLNRFQLKYVLYVLLGTLVYFFIYFVVVSAVAALVPSLNLEQEQDLGFKNPAGVLQLTMVFMSLVVLPPIAEETVFRGFMFAGLRSKLSFAAAAAITSVFFAIGHLQIGQGTPLLWVAGIDTFVLSMVLCYVREKTGSIWPTIGIHMLKNLVAFSFLYIIH